MKKLFGVSCSITMILVFTGFVNADLIGDNVFIEQHVPNLNTVAGSIEITVQEGHDTYVDPTEWPFSTFTVDVEASSFNVTFTRNTFFTVFDFNGLVVDDLNSVVNPDYILLGVTVTTNLTDWTESNLQFGNDFVALNLSGLSVNTTNQIAVDLELGPDPIPIPATMVLFVTGLVGIASVHKLRIRRCNKFIAPIRGHSEAG